MKTKQFTETLIDYIDGKVRRNDLMFKLTLGGGAGPGGGEGLPWNSIVGQLIQKRVAYDTTMSASPCMDSASGYWLQSGSLLDNLNIIRYRQLPATWFETSPTDLRGLSVNVASGVWYNDENSYFIFEGGESPTFTLPTVNPRIDVVYITPSGVIEIQQGAEAPSPSITMPTASGVLPTWAVYLPPSASGIGYPCETYSGYLYQDLRPFIAYPPGGGGVGAHNILQADVHTDTVTQACNQGSLMLGNAVNKWAELPLGGAGLALFSNGGTAVWELPLPPVAGAGYALVSMGVDWWDWDRTPTWTGPHLFQDLNLDTVDSCYAIEINYVKNAGVTGAADDMAGIYSKFEFDQVGGTIGKLYGAYIEAQLENGTTGAGDDIWGIHTYVDLNGGTANDDVWGLQAEIDSTGTTVDGNIWGLDGWIDLNTGSVGGDVIGLSSWIDIAVGYTSPGSDVYGLYTRVSVASAPAGDVCMLYLDEILGIDYGIYQSGTSDNYLGGDLGVGDNAPAGRIHAKDTRCVIRAEYTDNIRMGAFEIYEGAVYKGSIDIQGSAVVAPNVYLRNCLSITTGTGDIHLKPGSTFVGINLTAAPTCALDISGDIRVEDGDNIRVGAGSDLRLYHTAPSSNYIYSTGNANLYNYLAAGTGDWYVYTNATFRMIITDTGPIGIGYAIPVYDLDIVEAADHTHLALRTYSTTDAHNPHLYLMKSHHNTAGTLAATTDGDYLGVIEFYGVDTGPGWAHGAHISAIQRGAAGASYVETDLVFQTHSATAINANQLYLDGGTGFVGIGATPTQKLQVAGNILVNDGSWIGSDSAAAWLYNTTSSCISTLDWVGIGRTTPSYQLDVRDDIAGIVLHVFNDGDNANRHGIRIRCGPDADGGVQHFVNFRAGGNLHQGYLDNDAAGNMVLVDASDRKIKKGIKDYKFGDLRSKFKGVTHRSYTKRGSPNCHGYVAQELQEWFPEAVEEMTFYDEVEGQKGVVTETKLLGVSQMSLIAPMMEMIKQLILKVEQLEAR